MCVAIIYARRCDYCFGSDEDSKHTHYAGEYAGSLKGAGKLMTIPWDLSGMLSNAL